MLNLLFCSFNAYCRVLIFLFFIGSLLHRAVCTDAPAQKSASDGFLESLAANFLNFGPLISFVWEGRGGVTLIVFLILPATSTARVVCDHA